MTKYIIVIFSALILVWGLGAHKINTNKEVVVDVIEEEGLMYYSEDDSGIYSQDVNAFFEGLNAGDTAYIPSPTYTITNATMTSNDIGISTTDYGVYIRAENDGSRSYTLTCKYDEDGKIVSVEKRESDPVKVSTGVILQ